jgi:hypothetical protein
VGGVCGVDGGGGRKFVRGGFEVGDVVVRTEIGRLYGMAMRVSLLA